MDTDIVVISKLKMSMRQNFQHKIAEQIVAYLTILFLCGVTGRPLFVERERERERAECLC